MRPTLVALAALCAALLAAPAPAGADDVTMPWRAPIGCPSAAEFLDYVAAELDEPVGADELGLWVTVGVDRDWMWRARISDGSGSRRTMTARSCDELARAAALVVAMAHRDLHPQVAPPIPPPRVAEAAPAADLAAPPAVSIVAPNAPATGAPRLWLRGIAAIDLGTFNGAAPAVGIGAEITVPRWSLDLSMLRLSVGMSDQPGLHHVATGLAGRGCRLRTRPSRRVGVCAGLEVSRIEAAGYLGSTSRASALALGVQAGALASWRLVGPMQLRLDAGLGLMAIRPSFTMDSTFAAPSTLVARVGLSLEVRAR